MIIEAYFESFEARSRCRCL